MTCDGKKLRDQQQRTSEARLEQRTCRVSFNDPVTLSRRLYSQRKIYPEHGYTIILFYDSIRLKIPCSRI
jgi:hypothetical protein